MGKRYRTVLLIAGVAAVILGACAIVHNLFLVTEEDRVRKVIYAIADAAERMSPRGMIEHVAEDYRDPVMAAGKSELRLTLFQLFKRFDALYVHIRGTQIKVEGSRAHAAVAASAEAVPAGGKEKSNVFAERGDATFELEFEKRNGRWLLVSAIRPRLQFE